MLSSLAMAWSIFECSNHAVESLTPRGRLSAGVDKPVLPWLIR